MSHHKTGTQLLTMVRDVLDESTASFWTDAQLYRYISTAKDRVWNEVRKLKKDYFAVTRTSADGSLTILGESYSASDLAVTVGGTSITLPHDFATLKLIQVTTSGYESVRFERRALNHPDMRAALEITDNVNPSTLYFEIIGERTLRYAPKSLVALATTFTYIQTFADIDEASDELTMPHPFYLAVVEYAIASAMLQDDDPNAATHEARAKQIILDATGADERQDQDEEIVVGFLENW